MSDVALNVITIRYNTAYGTQPPNITILATEQLTSTHLPSLSVEGYEFIGWVHVNKDGHESSLSERMIISSEWIISDATNNPYVTFTAKWKKRKTDTPVEGGEDGEDGATFTPNVSTNGDLSWTNDKGLPNPPTVNIKGSPGKNGDKGDPGDDGISCTHEWDGTVLIVTSANGTSSADLKGEPGATGSFDMANPETTGVFYHKGNGAGNTGVIFKIQSNNGVLQGYGDASSAFHFAGVPIAIDAALIINGGMVFQTAGQNLDFNGASINNIQQITHRGSKGVISVGCDFNDGTLSDEQGHNFVVKNTNIGAGLGASDKAWSYQAFVPAADGTWERVFGVKADGTVFSKGVELATKDDVGGDFLPLTGGTLSGNLVPSGAINLGDDANRWESIFAKLYYFSDGSNRSQYKFGMYQWGDNFTFTSRTAANGWLRDCWQINATTGVTNFSARPTYNGEELALKSELPSGDNASSETVAALVARIEALEKALADKQDKVETWGDLV